MKIQSNTFFTSDTHFNHSADFMLKSRGFDDVYSQDNYLIKLWNDKITNNDIVFHLGDFVFNDPEGEKATELLERLNYKHLYLLWGNHNSGVKKIYRNAKNQLLPDNLQNLNVYPLSVNNIAPNKTITFLGDYIEIFYKKQMIVLFHFAIKNFHKNGNGSWHLCGHSHGNDKKLNKDERENGKILDMSFDMFKGPVHIDDINDIMNTKSLKVFDHH